MKILSHTGAKNVKFLSYAGVKNVKIANKHIHTKKRHTYAYLAIPHRVTLSYLSKTHYNVEYILYRFQIQSS